MDEGRKERIFTIKMGNKFDGTIYKYKTMLKSFRVSMQYLISNFSEYYLKIPFLKLFQYLSDKTEGRKIKLLTAKTAVIINNQNFKDRIVFQLRETIGNLQKKDSISIFNENKDGIFKVDTKIKIPNLTLFFVRH